MFGIVGDVCGISCIVGDMFVIFCTLFFVFHVFACCVLYTCFVFPVFLYGLHSHNACCVSLIWGANQKMRVSLSRGLQYPSRHLSKAYPPVEHPLDLLKLRTKVSLRYQKYESENLMSLEPLQCISPPWVLYEFVHTYAYICIHMHTYAHTCIRLPTRFALVRVRACMHEFVHTYAYICTYMSTATQQIRPLSLSRYGVATVSRLIKITCLFCKRAL